MLREKRLPLAFIDPDGTFEQSDEYGGKPERIPFAAWRWAGLPDLALFEGEPDAALVQQRVRMRYEYRVQVIGGEPVCGACCVERLRPPTTGATGMIRAWRKMRNDGALNRIPTLHGGRGVRARGGECAARRGNGTVRDGPVSG